MRIMKRLQSVWLLALFACLGTGCATPSLMRPSAGEPGPIPADHARIIFMRASNVGGAIASTTLDITANEPKMMGVLTPMHKVACDVTPGKHTFMLLGENADFMEADVLAGKTYYAIVTPRMGWWKARFSFHPFKQVAGESEFQIGSPELTEWLSACTYVEPTPKADEWIQAKASEIKAKKEDYWGKWERMLEKDKQWKRLDPQDGE